MSLKDNRTVNLRVATTNSPVALYKEKVEEKQVAFDEYEDDIADLMKCLQQPWQRKKAAS